jgi:hypothetical protein
VSSCGAVLSSALLWVVLVKLFCLDVVVHVSFVCWIIGWRNKTSLLADGQKNEGTGQTWNEGGERAAGQVTDDGREGTD